MFLLKPGVIQCGNFLYYASVLHLVAFSSPTTTPLFLKLRNNSSDANYNNIQATCQWLN